MAGFFIRLCYSVISSLLILPGLINNKPIPATTLNQRIGSMLFINEREYAMPGCFISVPSSATFLPLMLFLLFF
jgi:hypothetical protein